MKDLTHAAQGVLTLTVTGAYPERFLNALAEQGVLFWGAQPLDPVTLRVKLHVRARRRAEQTAARLMCDVRVEGERGLPRLLARFRRRYGFLAGMTLSVAALLLLSQFILTVKVSGNETVPPAVILSEVRRLGVKPGAFGPGLDEGLIAQQALLALDDLSWMAVNLHGTRAEVLVREKDPKPELEDQRRPADVVAEATGILTHLETWEGNALFQKGDTVVAGDVVISGWVPFDPPEYSDVDLGGRSVKAEGRVEARTWRALTASIPLECTVKEPTGREAVRWSLCVFGKRLNFYRNSGISFGEYDKINQEHRLTLPNGTVLPVSLTEERFREVEHLSVPLDVQGAEAMLSQRLEARLEALVEDGEVVKSEVSCVEDGGLFTVRLLAECREEIGKTVFWPQYEGGMEP